MEFRHKLEEKIRRKELEIQDLETQIREGKAYIQALNETLKVLPRELVAGGIESSFRKGSLADKAKKAIEAHGAPMHVDELLEAMKLKNTTKTKRSVAGTLAFYVRKGEVFERTAPNTFGLIGMKSEDSEENDGQPHVTGLREVQESGAGPKSRPAGRG